MLPKTDERFKLLLSYVQITFILIWTNKYVFFFGFVHLEHPGKRFPVYK